MTTQCDCLVCTCRGSLGHHPTGRDPQGVYLDPDLKLPFCHDDHELAHDDWRMLRIADPARGGEGAVPLTLVERVELRLRRLAATTGRLAAACPGWVWIGELARSFKRWADELALDIRARDQRDPGWRAGGAFYPACG
jgi:hypothetical protein